jgi:hypothetical protein
MTSSREHDNRQTGDPVMARIEEQLRHGNYLRSDERPLQRIIDDDEAEVVRLGLDLEAVTDKMRHLFEQGRKAMGDPVVVDDAYEVTVLEYRGTTPSPWMDHYNAPKSVVETRNVNTGRALRFSLLSLHLIRNYGFFQGKGSPFRIEPRDLHEFFL